MKPSASIVIVFAIIALLAFSFFSSFFVVVESGHVGVIRTLGAVKPNPLPEGFHFKKPIMDVVEQVDVRLATASSKAASASKDLQTVHTDVTLQYSMNGSIAPQVYQKIGPRAMVSSVVVEPAIQESVKAVTAQYTAEQLVTNRAEVKLKIQEAISNFVHKTLEEKGLTSAVTIANVAITDFEFSPEFNRAIELKVKAEQEALQAKNEKLKRVTQAEAAAAEKKLGADADAYEIEVNSKSRADAIKREAEALKNNPELIQLRLAEKWNGELPKFTGNATPFIDLKDLSKSAEQGK